MGIWDKEKKELEKLWGDTKGKNGMVRTTEQFLSMNTFEDEDTGDVLVNIPPDKFN